VKADGTELPIMLISWSGKFSQLLEGKLTLSQLKPGQVPLIEMKAVLQATLFFPWSERSGSDMAL